MACISIYLQLCGNRHGSWISLEFYMMGNSHTQVPSLHVCSQLEVLALWQGWLISVYSYSICHFIVFFLFLKRSVASLLYIDKLCDFCGWPHICIGIVEKLANCGAKMVIISNSSRRASTTIEKISSLGFNPALFLGAITSGELTHQCLLRFKFPPSIILLWNLKVSFGFGECHKLSWTGEMTHGLLH